MTVKQLANTLKGQGHEVRLYIRPDGSARIISLDGQKFSYNSSLGNQLARQMLNIQLSERQESQRASARASKASRDTLSATKKYDKAFYEEYKRLQREAAHGRHPQSITWEATKKGYHKYGSQMTLERLKGIVEYASGRANMAHIEELLKSINSAIAELAGDEDAVTRLNKLYIWLDTNRNKLSAEGVRNSVGLLYDVEKGSYKGSTENLVKQIIDNVSDGGKMFNATVDEEGNVKKTNRKREQKEFNFPEIKGTSYKVF